MLFKDASGKGLSMLRAAAVPQDRIGYIAVSAKQGQLS